MRTLHALASLLLLIACRDAGAGTTEKTLRFTAIPDEKTTELAEKYAPVAAYLSEQLGVPVEYVAAASYPGSVEMFKNGDVHLAWFGGLSSLQARQAVQGSRAIAQGKEDLEFASYFIAHKDTGLELSDTLPPNLGEFSFTFGPEGSTSGRLMPEHFIREHTGKGPLELFKTTPGYSIGHDKTVELVESGQVQIGAVNYTVYERRVKDGTTDPEVCRVIWRTPAYADYNFTVHPELEQMFGEGFIPKLQQALLDMNDPELLKIMRRSALVSASNAEFDALSAVAKNLELLR